MSSVISFSIPNGFRFNHHTRTVRLDEAAAILCTRRQRRYSSVTRRDLDFTLRQDAVVCPYCGRSTPAYDRFMEEDKPAGYVAEPRISAPEINAWLMNRSLFEDDQELVLNNVWNEDYFQCPRCGRISFAYPTSSRVELSIAKGVIRFTAFDSQGGLDVSSYLMAAAVSGYQLRFPLCETVCFAKGGKTWMSVVDARNHVLKIRDISVPNTDWYHSKVCLLLTHSRLARRKLAQAFESVWNSPLPYTHAELTPETFLLLNRHRGFSRIFFDMLPSDDGMIDRSFRSTARRLWAVQLLTKLYASSGLPTQKTIKKNFYEMPYLFWYLPELVKLWGAFDNTDLFNVFLKRTACYDVLTFFHFYPTCIDFFCDFAREKGCKAFIRIISRAEDLEKVQAYAWRYACGNDSLRRSERKRWKNWDSILRSDISFSGIFPPGIRAGVRYRNLDVAGFQFCWLTGKKAFVQAGEALDNCLAEHGPDDMKVAVIRQGAAILAAVELRNGRITQAKMHHNLPIDRESRLWEAIIKWSMICHYSIDIPEEDDDLLPF